MGVPDMKLDRFYSMNFFLAQIKALTQKLIDLKKGLNRSLDLLDLNYKVLMRKKWPKC